MLKARVSRAHHIRQSTHGISNNEQRNRIDAGIERCCRERCDITKSQDEARKRQRKHRKRIQHSSTRHSLARQKVSDGNPKNDVDDRAQAAKKETVLDAEECEVMAKHIFIKLKSVFTGKHAQKPALRH